MNGRVSRRDMLFGALRRSTAPPPPPPPRAGVRHAVAPDPASDAPVQAVIQGRHCLAYQHVTCSTCYERCPHPGAIVRERGIPRVVADHCTGCRVCHDVCPAPTNAILLIQGRRPTGAPA